MPGHTPDEHEPELDGFPVDGESSGPVVRDEIELLVSEFVELNRLGKSPSIESYERRYPALAEQIRELFPMVLALEQWKSDRESDGLRLQLPDDFHLERLGDCRIIREIGRGGMGVVFEALQGVIERRVAVKLLPWRLSLVPQRKSQFEQEALTFARLQHPNIVPIYNFGTHEDYAYYVMQYVESLSLARVIERLRVQPQVVFEAELAAQAGRPSVASSNTPLRGLRRDSWKAIARIGVQVAQALRCAHEQGVLHNDIKPANLLIDASGRVFVTDFGLASQLNSEQAQKDDRLTGTLRYMAPERFQGINTATSDIYALGMTLFELATRETGFVAKNRVELLEQITAGKLRRPTEVDPAIPAGLEAILIKATSTAPTDRYASAGELAADLTRFINGEAVLAPPPPRRLFPWRRNS